MAQIMEDKYVLAQSASQTISTVGQELSVNIQLAATTNSVNSGSVTGVVSNSSANPIANALVKLMDTNYNPISHAITNSSGSYTLNNVAPGSYSVFAIAQGMALQQSPQFSVTQLQTATQNLTLQADPSMSLAIIPGIVLDSSTNNPINGAVASLYSVGLNGVKTLQSILYTNSYGQFVFRQVAIGNYSITITALGYTTTTTTATVTTAGQIIPVNVSMAQDSTAGTGTISGIVTNPNNVAISGADVILYRVNSDSSLTPIAFTRTNTNGIYLFGKVSAGSYKVKSNQTQLVTVGVTTNYSPNFNYFYISNYSNLSVNATTGTLAGGASLQNNNQLVGLIGGTTGGSVTVSVTPPSAGNYIMAVQYMNGDTTARTLLVDVNGTNTGTTYSCPASGGWNMNNMSIINIPVALTASANTIKLYNTTASGPNIGMIYFAPVTNFNGINGTLANGAVIPGANPDFVGAIGDTGGTLTINPTVPIAGQYTLGIQYLAGDAARPIQVSVNGTPTGTTYSCPKTANWTTASAGIFNVTVNLTAGANTIQFFNSPNASGPWVGMLTMTPVFQVNYYNATNATLTGSATVSGSFVTGIQSGNGTLTISPTVPSAGQYNFGILYVAPDNTKQCNIAVNGNTTNQIYTFSQTTDLTATNVLVLNTQITLASGANSIKIFNQ